MIDCMAWNLSSVPLVTQQSSRVSTSHFPRRTNNRVNPRYTVSTFHALPSVLFQVQCLLQLEQVVPLDQDSKDRNNPLFQTLFAMSKKPICIETVKVFLSSCWVKTSNSAVRSHSLKVRHDRFSGNLEICSDEDLTFANLHQPPIICIFL